MSGAVNYVRQRFQLLRQIGLPPYCRHSGCALQAEGSECRLAPAFDLTARPWSGVGRCSESSCTQVHSKGCNWVPLRPPPA